MLWKRVISGNFLPTAAQVTTNYNKKTVANCGNNSKIASNDTNYWLKWKKYRKHYGNVTEYSQSTDFKHIQTLIDKARDNYPTIKYNIVVSACQFMGFIKVDKRHDFSGFLFMAAIHALFLLFLNWKFTKFLEPTNKIPYEFPVTQK